MVLLASVTHRGVQMGTTDEEECVKDDVVRVLMGLAGDAPQYAHRYTS
mgnify:CR=1 FL=1